MSNQIVITSGAKLRDLDDVIIGTDGILSSVAFNVANGVPRLDENGKILVSQLPNSVMEFKGVWNAATNTPTLANGTGNAGDVWLCNVAGTVDFGAGPIAFAVGDYAVYTGTVWARSSGATGTVTSVGVSRDGNALTITGSPVTTSGTINLGFSGDNTQYINGAGNLTTFPTLITSIGLTMPAAFGVSNSPLTANGTIGVTALGYPSQYIRGDGTLADFPTSGGGGSSVSYYFNGGTSQGTIGGTTYYEMSKIANTGTGVDFNKTGDGLITAFLTDAGDPSLLQIPAGNWNYEIYASMSANGGVPELYAELYVYNGTTFTLISTSSNEILYDGTNLNLYSFAMAVPETVLTVTDRLAIKLYATNSGGKTTTVHTQNGHLCQVITTFTTGLTALNGLTAQVQYFGTGTSGSDFNIVSSVDTHTFNLPNASATKRGALSAADWYNFNSKQDYITAGTTLEYWRGDKTWQTLDTSVVPELTNLYFTNARARTAISLTTTGSTGASTYDNSTGVLNIPNYADQYVGTVTSVGLSAPTGFSVSGSPVTSSGTLALTFASGYSLPTNIKQSNWDDAYTWVAAFPTQTGNTGKFLTTDGSSLSWAANPLGTVTSVAMTVPTGLSISGSPITTSGTLAVTLTAGYSIPTTASQTNWDTAYTNRITSLTTTGTSGAATLISNVLNIPQYQAALTNPVTGTGDSGYVAFWNSASSINGESNLFWDAPSNRLGINIIPSYTLHTYANNNTTSASAVIRGEYYGAIISTDSILSTYYALSVKNGSNTSIIQARADGKVGINADANNYTLYVNGNGLYEGNVQITNTSPLFITNAPTGESFAGGLSTRINGVEKARFAWNTAAGAYIYDPSNLGLSYINSSDATKFRVSSTGDAAFGTGTTISGGGAARWVTIDADSGNTYSGGVVYAIGGVAKGYSYFENGYLNFQGNTSIGVRLRTNATTNALTIESGGDAAFVGNLTAYGYDSSNGYFRVNRSGVYYGGIGLSNWAFSGDTANDIAIIAINKFKVGTNNSSPSFLIDTSGRVAINASSTDFRLYVVGDSGNWASKIYNTNGTETVAVYTALGAGYGIAVDSSSNSSGTYLMKLMAGTGGGGAGTIPVIYALANQCVGFGNQTPKRLLDVGNATTATIPSWAKIVASGTSGTAIGASTGTKLLYLYNDTGVYKLDAYDYGTSTALPITIGGNGGAVLINTTSTVSGGGALQVNGNVNINGVFQINGVTIGGGGGSGVTGTGTSGYHTKWTGSTTLGNGIIYDNGTAISLASNAPRSLLDLGYKDDSTTASYIMFGGVNGPEDNAGTGYGGGIVFKYYDTGGSYTKRSAGILQTAEGNYIRAGLAFFTNNTANTTTDWTEKMRLRDTGQLLIGAISSTYGASAGYNFGMIGVSSQAFISIARSGQTLDSQGMILGVDTSNAYLTVRDNINLIFQTNNQNRVTITNTGDTRVGSSEITGGGKLQVLGDVNISGNFKINGVTISAGIGGSGTVNYLPKFATTTTIGNSQIFDNGTSVLINTTSGSGAKFIVNSSSDADYFKITSSNTDNIFTVGTLGTAVSAFGYMSLIRGGVNKVYLSANETSFIGGGNLLIATSTDTYSYAKLQVNGTMVQFNTYNRQTTSYTLVLTDAGKIVETNSASANIVTIPLNSSVAYAIGTEITLMQYGAGQTTIVATSGVTLRSNSSYTKIASQYTGVTLLKVATNEWYIIGNLSA